MTHPYWSDSNQKQNSISQTWNFLAFITLSILFPSLGIFFLGSILQLAPIHQDLKSFTLLKPSQTTKPYRSLPLLKSTWILILNGDSGIYYSLFCGISYIELWHDVLCSLDFTSFNDSFCPHNTLHSVFAQCLNIVEQLVFTTIKIIKKSSDFLGTNLSKKKRECAVLKFLCFLRETS